MLICPNCEKALARVTEQGEVSWTCRYCGGRAVGLTLLQKKASKRVIAELLTSARQSDTPRKRRCPICNQLMAYIHVPRMAAPSTLPVDLCTSCKFVWFDPKEYEGVTEKPPEASAATAMLDTKWKWIPAIFGMPVERENPPVVSRPWATWTLAATIALVSFLAFASLEKAVLQFGLVPARFWRYGGLTLVSSFFLHGGLLHLLSNLYFLVVFGDNVEDYLGRGRFLLLLLLASLAGDLVHIAFDPRSTLPSIGASGGISGIMVLYGLQFPRARLLVLLTRLFFWPLKIQARTALLVWFLFQFFGAWQQLAGFSHVNALAHLGGAAVGFGFWLWLGRT